VDSEDREVICPECGAVVPPRKVFCRVCFRQVRYYGRGLGRYQDMPRQWGALLGGLIGLSAVLPMVVQGSVNALGYVCLLPFVVALGAGLGAWLAVLEIVPMRGLIVGTVTWGVTSAASLVGLLGGGMAGGFGAVGGLLAFGTGGALVGLAIWEGVPRALRDREARRAEERWRLEDRRDEEYHRRLEEAHRRQGSQPDDLPE